jgi:hypothetical protein
MLYPLLTGAIKCMTLAYMKTKQTSGNRRSKDRVVKSLSLPASLVERVQAEADKHYGGDFTRATLEILATRYVEAKKFLRENETFKFCCRANRLKMKYTTQTDRASRARQSTRQSRTLGWKSKTMATVTFILRTPPRKTLSVTPFLSAALTLTPLQNG